jgi:hypothetical protein
MDKSEEIDTSMNPRSGNQLPAHSEVSQEMYLHTSQKNPGPSLAHSDVGTFSNNMAKAEAKSFKKLFPMKNNLSNSSVSIKKNIKPLTSLTVNEYQIGYDHIFQNEGKISIFYYYEFFF